MSFLEYLRETPPENCLLKSSEKFAIFRELKKISKEVSRTLLTHQSLVKQAKETRLVSRESLAACQSLARAKIPSLLGKSILLLLHQYTIL